MRGGGLTRACCRCLLPTAASAAPAACVRTRGALIPSALHPCLNPLRCSLDIPTEDFQDSVTLTALRRSSSKGGTAILIQAVAPGSAAERAGILPGQQLLGIR